MTKLPIYIMFILVVLLCGVCYGTIHYHPFSEGINYGAMNHARALVEGEYRKVGLNYHVR